MNYDLAIMALEGLARAPITVRAESGVVTIEGDQEAFKHLARLCLLLGGASFDGSGGFELQPGTHTTSASPMLRLQLPLE